MDKYFYGKLLGEIYRIQNKLGLQTASEGRIFGLLNGVEEAIDEELNGLQRIEKHKVDTVCDYFDPYYKGEKQLDEMPSLLEFRLELEPHGVNESDLITIFKYLKANDRYTLEIDELGNYEISRDIMHLDTSYDFTHSVEIKTFRYIVGGKTAAEIEILCFADGFFAGQGIIHFSNDEKFSTKKVYDNLDEALKNCYKIIEDKIKDHEWFQSIKEEHDKAK